MEVAFPLIPHHIGDSAGPSSRTFRFPSGADLCANGRSTLREQMAADLLVSALLARQEFRSHAQHVSDASESEDAASKLAQGYGRGKVRAIVTELLLRVADDPGVRVADDPGVRHAALIIGARAHSVEDLGPRWVVPAAGEDIVFFEDGEDEARALANETSSEVLYRPGNSARAGRYALGEPFMTPLLIGAHLIAARGAGFCLGWRGTGNDRRPCESKAVKNYRPYCGRHGGWDYRLKRGAWETERDEAIRRVSTLAAPAIAGGIRASRTPAAHLP